MRSIIAQLKQVLLDKIEILDDLIQGQIRMKEFLLNPQWGKYFDVLTPQQDKLKNLQRNLKAQQNCAMKLAQVFGMDPRTPFMDVLPNLSAKDRNELLPLFEASRKHAEKLQSLGQLSDRMMKAQNEFTVKWVESWQQKQVPTHALYNSFGYHVPRPPVSVFQREA